jgi:hypothetical protein
MNPDNVSTILTGIASSVIFAIVIYFTLPILKSIGKKAISELEELNRSFRTHIISKLADKQSSHMGDISAIAIFVVPLIIGITMVITEDIDLSTGLISGHLLSKVFGFTTMILVFIVLGFRFLLREYISQKIKVFETDVTILSPNLSGREIDEIKSDWAQMRSIEDYEQLISKVDMLKKKSISRDES